MRLLPLLLALSVPLAAEEDVHGLDVLQTIKTVKEWMGPGTPDPKKPWASSLGALTDPDPQTHAPAMRDLILRGSRDARVLKDLEVLAQDGDWRVRSRVVEVLSGIGGAQVVPLLLLLSSDSKPAVRELATLGLGKAAGPEAFARLSALLRAQESTIRQQAAASLGAFGDPAAIGLLAADDGEADDLVRRERERALARLALDPRAVPVLLDLLPGSAGIQRDMLLQTAQRTADRRLSASLAAIAVDPGRGARDSRRADPSAWTQFLALQALGTCGDLRAVPDVVRLATNADGDSIAVSAAETLLLITGYRAHPGTAWKVWWADHAKDLARWTLRDDLLAHLHDPTWTVTRADLQAFSVDELRPLVDAVLGEPAGRLAPWFPPRALAALRADDPARWAPVLAERAIATPSRDLSQRLGLILLLDDLEGPTTVEALGRLLDDLRKRIDTEEEDAKSRKGPAPDHAAETLALEGALRRRGH